MAQTRQGPAPASPGQTAAPGAGARRGPARPRDACAHRPRRMPPQIGGGVQQRRAVVEASQPGVALAAEQASHHAGFVAVIDAQRLGGPDLAVRAKTVLLRQHAREILRREAVFRHPPAVGEACAILLAEFRIGVADKTLVLVDVLPMRPFPLAICRKLPRAIVRILRISFPVPLGARKRLAAGRRKLLLAAARRRSGRARARRLRRAQKAPRETEKHGVILDIAFVEVPRRAAAGSNRALARKALRVGGARRLASRRWQPWPAVR